VSSDAVNDDSGEFNPAMRNRDTLKFASVRATTRDAQGDAVVLSQQVINRVLQVGERGRECPFGALEFTDIHFRAAQVADVVISNERVERSMKTRIGKCDPTPNQILVLPGLHSLSFSSPVEMPYETRIIKCNTQSRPASLPSFLTSPAIALEL
jgi:hypothetical protein